MHEVHTRVGCGSHRAASIPRLQSWLHQEGHLDGCLEGHPDGHLVNLHIIYYIFIMIDSPVFVTK